MDSIIFPRTGEIPLEFTGEIIFTETTDTPGKKKCSRYHQLRLARTAGGSFVAFSGSLLPPSPERASFSPSAIMTTIGPRLEQLKKSPRGSRHSIRFVYYWDFQPENSLRKSRKD